MDAVACFMARQPGVQAVEAKLKPYLAAPRDTGTVEGFVAAGLGVAIVPMTRRSLAAEPSASVAYLGITDAGAARDIGIAWSTERRLLPAAERFRRHVVDEVRGRSL